MKIKQHVWTLWLCSFSSRWSWVLMMFGSCVTKMGQRDEKRKKTMSLKWKTSYWFKSLALMPELDQTEKWAAFMDEEQWLAKWTWTKMHGRNETKYPDALKNTCANQTCRKWMLMLCVPTKSVIFTFYHSHYVFPSQIFQMGNCAYPPHLHSVR